MTKSGHSSGDAARPELRSLTVGDRPHVVIRASAGSGKTYQLSNRYLDLLHRGASAETILASTFTRKAAGEILERILRRLAQASLEKSKAQELGAAIGAPVLTTADARTMLATLCRSLHRVSVSTLDSFFNRIAQAFSFELKLPTDPHIVGVDDPAVAQLRLAAIEAMLGDQDTQTLVDLLRRLHHDAAMRSVTDAIDNIVKRLYDIYRQSRREHWNALKLPAMPTKDEAAAAIEALAPLAEAEEDRRIAKAVATHLGNALVGNWEAFLGKGLTKAMVENPADPQFYKKPIPAHIQAALRPLIVVAQGFFLQRTAEQTRATFELMQRFDSHYTRLRERERVLLFSDLPHKLAHELPRQSEELAADIYFRLDAAVQHLLLDEFQDTSFEQWAVLRPFAEEVASHSDASRSFFCVGDVKQAIYGWRGGRAEIFDRVEEGLHLDEDARVELSVSYRSSQVVLDAVNEVFGAIGGNRGWRELEDAQEAGRWAKAFTRHEAHKDLPGYVELMNSSVGDDGEENSDGHGDGEDEQEETSADATRAHLTFCAQRIKALAEEAPRCSVGVLATMNKTVTSLVFELRRLGVDASAEGAGTLAGDPAVDVILSALRLADHPGHTIAAHHLATSPLAPVIGLRHADNVAECDAAAHRIRDAVMTLGYPRLLTDWAIKLAPSCDERSATKLAQLVELADQFEPALTLRIGDFVDYIESLAVESPSSSQVRVLTTHRAKGLEFDIVVLVELSRSLGSVGNPVVCVDRDPETDEVRAVFRGTNKMVRSLSPQLQEAYRQEKVRRLRDDLCAMYVAMTRARHALHLIVRPIKVGKSGPSTTGRSDQSQAALLRGALVIDGEEAFGHGGDVLFSQGDPRWHSRLASAAAAPPPAREPMRELSFARPSAPAPTRRNWRAVAPSSLAAHAHNPVSDLLDLGVDDGRRRGTLMHAWFAQIGWLEEGVPTDSQLLSAANAGLSVVKADDPWLARQVAAFRRMLTMPQITAQLQSPRLDRGENVELWREQPFAVRLGDELLSGTFDRVHVFLQGGRPKRALVLDFKTDHVSDDEGNLPLLVEQYRPQIDAYREALSQMLKLEPTKVHGMLLFVGAGRSCAV